MSRLVHLFLQSYEADIVLDALQGLRLSFLKTGMETDSIDELICMVKEQIEVGQTIEKWEENKNGHL